MEMLVLLPVLSGKAMVVGKAVVLETGVMAEAGMLEGGRMLTPAATQRAKNFNLHGNEIAKTL